MSSTFPGTPDPSNSAQLSDAETQQLLLALRRKEGDWVGWGQACQTLQKSGYSPQRIFEETGFEPIQQNQIIVASQVFAALSSEQTPAEVRQHFQWRGSDILYEFRILTQAERVAAASLAFSKGLDADEAHECAKGIKAYSRLASQPPGFSSFAEAPGDAIAYYYWKLARQQSDLQQRSKLIAQGLRFAESPSARQAIEKLLTDFTVVKSRPAPILPTYRMDSEEELPRIVPVAGRMPLSVEDFRAVPLLEDEGPFRIVKFSGVGAWVPVPGWQVVLLAEDPVVVLAHSDHLPVEWTGQPEEVLLMIDRSKREWNPDSYFLADVEGRLQVQWTEDAPAHPLLGRVLLALRPKRILDEDFMKDPWQVEE